MSGADNNRRTNNMNNATTQKNGYKAFYKGKQIDIYATSSYQAQQLAAKEFKAKKSYEVTVVLCEKAGEQVTHTPDF